MSSQALPKAAESGDETTEVLIELCPLYGRPAAHWERAAHRTRQPGVVGRRLI